MKKITKFGVLATACMLLMQGCDAKEENYDSLLNPNKPVTLEIWTYYNGTQKAAFDELGSAAPQNGESLIRTSTHLLGMKLGYHRAEHMSRLAARLPGRYNK